MLGMPSITNRKDISAAYDKLSKRKGKIVSGTDIMDGDIVRGLVERQIVYTMLLARVEDNGDLTLCLAHDQLYSNGYFASRIPVKKLSEVSYRRIATKDEYPQAQREPEITTLVYFNPDDTVCCQNYIHGLEGQHFTMTVAEYAVRKEAEKEVRKWEETNSPCQKCKLGA
jgi:hypothetical protein